MVRVKKQPIRGDLSEKAIKAPKTGVNKKDNPTYQKYEKWVKSRGFKALRAHLLERENYTCQGCGRTLEEITESGKKITLQAHHRSYRYVGLGDERELSDLTCLCSVCHKGLHSAPSNLRRFTDKSPIENNLKENPEMRCFLDKKDE